MKHPVLNPRTVDTFPWPIAPAPSTKVCFQPFLFQNIVSGYCEQMSGHAKKQKNTVEGDRARIRTRQGRNDQARNLKQL